MESDSNSRLARTLSIYDEVVGEHPEVSRKGKTLPYTAINGNMFSYVDAEGTLALRLSASDREAFIADHDTALMVSHGTVMKEYVRVPDAMLLDRESLSRYYRKSLEYARTLKAKPTKK